MPRGEYYERTHETEEIDCSRGVLFDTEAGREGKMKSLQLCFL